MTKDISTICGPNKNNTDLINIGNDPNFIFKPDENYSPIQLFDIEGNTITVNSWLECANYVNGGWSNIILQKNMAEIYLFYGLCVVVTIFLFRDAIKFYKRHNVS